MTTFDPALAEEAFDDDVEGLSEFLRSVLTSMETSFARVREAAAAGDAPALRAAAHSVKGSSGHLGAGGVGEIAATVENAAREGRIETSDTIDALERAIAALHPVIDDYLRRRAASS